MIPELDNKPFANTYADYLLKYQNIKITRDNQGKEEELFTRARTIYPPRWKELEFYVTPEVAVGSFQKTRYQKKITDIGTLTSLGYGIFRHSVQGMGGFRRTNQTLVCSIRKLGTTIDNPYTGGFGTGTKPATTIPKDHEIIWDQTYQTLRIAGKNSDGRVIYMKGKPKNPANRKEESFTEMIARLNGESYDEGEEIKIKIPELIVGLNLEQHKIACIPRMIDPPRMGWCGSTGCGKTIWMHAVIDQLTHSWKALTPYLNDWKEETGTWSTETKTTDFRIMLKNLGLPTMPLPAVYLYPQIRGYDKEKEDFLEPHEQKIAYYTSLPWKEILERYNLLFSDFEEMKMGKSVRRIPWEDIKEAKNPADLFNILGNSRLLQNEDALGRVISTFKFLFSKGLMDIDSGLGSTWKIQKKIEDKTIDEENLHPLLAVMKCNLTPIFVTKQLQTVMFGNTTFISSYVKYLTTLILDAKKNTKLFREDLIVPFIDELEDIIRRGASEPIIELSALGRSSNIGFGWGTTNYTGVPPSILNNTHYLFAMKTNDTNAICKDFTAPKHVKDDMATLGKQRPLEGYLFHKNPIITYDLENGDREELKDEPIKLIPIPPMSEHQRPGLVNQ